MNWDELEPMASRWRSEGEAHAAAVNAYVADGERDGWTQAGPPPQDPRRDIAPLVLEAVREANAAGETEELRQRFPPAFEPLVPLLPVPAVCVGPVLLLESGAMVSCVADRGVFLTDDRATTLLNGVVSIGRSPDRRVFARAYETGIELLDGWEGPVVRRLPWPTGREGVPEETVVQQMQAVKQGATIIPFPDGQRALLVHETGVFVLSEDQARRVHPDHDTVTEWIAWSSEHYPQQPVSLAVAMAHGAISLDGRLIAVGSQDGNHRLLNADLQKVATVAPLESYPHHAIFSADGSQVAFNSCHTYAGSTVGVPLTLVPGLDATGPGFDPRLVVLDDTCRVYASVARGDEYVFGDARGYLRARSTAGLHTWQHFLGANISGMDSSADGRKLAVGTCAGMLHLLDLDHTQPDPLTIGTSTHRERRRWLFWPGEPEPLVW